METMAYQVYVWSFLWISIMLGIASTQHTAGQFKMSLQYKDVLPASGAVSLKGRFSLLTCGSMCVSDKHCQTIFHKPTEKKCFLHMYPIWTNTPLQQENGTFVYEILSPCSDFDFVHNRAGNMCFKVIWSGNSSSFHAIESCQQFGTILISLETNQRLKFVTEYIRNYYKFTTNTRKTFQIGLNNTQVPGHKIWKWSSGANLTTNLEISFWLNNYDGNMRDCPVGHCGVFEVKQTATGVFDNCCMKVSNMVICSKNLPNS